MANDDGLGVASSLAELVLLTGATSEEDLAAEVEDRWNDPPDFVELRDDEGDHGTELTVVVEVGSVGQYTMTKRYPFTVAELWAEIGRMDDDYVMDCRLRFGLPEDLVEGGTSWLASWPTGGGSRRRTWRG